MKIETKVKDMPVVIFALDERTISLCEKSFQKFGFKNIITFDQRIGFSEKLYEFFKLSQSSQHDLFLRTDADRISLPGVIDFCKQSISDYESKKGYFIGEGKGYECFLENSRIRGATPHIFSREVMEYCLENKDRMINDVQKPESFIGYYFKKNYGAVRDYSFLTNIHEIEQYPSKMYQAFLNRILRGHLSYYNLKNLMSDPLYSYPMKKALDESRKNYVKQKSMNYHEDSTTDEKLIYLDNTMGPILNPDEVLKNILSNFNQETK